MLPSSNLAIHVNQNGISTDIIIIKSGFSSDDLEIYILRSKCCRCWHV
jgi:hypothetical protein